MFSRALWGKNSKNPFYSQKTGGVFPFPPLEKNGIFTSKYVFNQPRLEPDEHAVGSVILHYDKSCDIVVAIGSGVINDICKVLSCVANVPYIIVATAPSMDGYASASSSMARDGLKVTVSTKCPDVIIGDTEILKTAPDIMLKAFEIAGYTQKDIEDKFSALYNAFHYGAPPHAGMAPGIDRMVMLLAEEESIREVVAFPMNGNAQDMLLGAPNTVTEQQLREVHIKLR